MIIKNSTLFMFIGLLLPLICNTSHGSSDAKSKDENPAARSEHGAEGVQPKDRRWKKPASHIATSLTTIGYGVGAGAIVYQQFKGQNFFGTGVNAQVFALDCILDCFFPNLKRGDANYAQQTAKAKSFLTSVHMLTTFAAASAAMVWYLRSEKYDRAMHKRKKTFNQLHAQDPYGAITSNREDKQYWQEIPPLEEIEVELSSPAQTRTTAKYALAGATAAAYPSRIAAKTAQGYNTNFLTIAGTLLGAGVGALWGYSKSCSKKSVLDIIESDDDSAAYKLWPQHHYILHVRDKNGKTIKDLVAKKSKVGTVVAKIELFDAVDRKDTKKIESLYSEYPQLRESLPQNKKRKPLLSTPPPKPPKNKDAKKVIEPTLQPNKQRRYTTAAGTIFYSKFDQRRDGDGDAWKPVPLTWGQAVQ